MNAKTTKVCDFLLNYVSSDAVSVGTLLPPETDLATQFDVSRMNAHAAMKVLERHGLVYSRRGAGTFVSKKPSPSLISHLKGLSVKRAHVVVGFEPVPLHWTDETLSQLEELLSEAGFVVEYVQIPAPLTCESLESMLKKITDEGSSALVLILPKEAGLFFEKNAGLIFQYHRNIFLFDRGDIPPGSWPFHVISLDPFAEGVLAAQYVYDKGYRRAVFWSPFTEGKYWDHQRATGFVLGMQRASGGLICPEILKFEGQKGADDVCKHLLDSDGSCAVVTVNDQAAVWLKEAAELHNLHAPENFGLLGFDDNPQFRHCNLSTVAPPLAGIGGILARAISGSLLPTDEFSSFVLRLPSRIIDRGSCALSKSSNRSVNNPT